MPYNRARKTTARLFMSPLENPNASIEVLEPIKVIDLIPPQAIRRFEEGGGVVRVGGNLVPRELWSFVTIKPKADLLVDFVYVPRGKKSFLLMAAVALVAVTAFIATGGVALLFGLGATSTFAAGGLGASLLASGVGIAGSLALQALSAPPKASNSGDNSTAAQAGISGNPVSPLDTLPVVFGLIGTSPPMLAPPYTYWDGDDIYARGVVGVQGRCAITNIKINGIPIDDFDGVTYETREGRDGDDSARTLFTQTVIEERDGVTLSSFKTESVSTKNDRLKDQTTPDNSSPSWHAFRTAGEFSEVVFRFQFPAGIVYTATSVAACVALEVEMRKVGDASWRRLPVFYIADQKAGSGPMRCELRIKREVLPAGLHFCYAGSEYPIFNADNEVAQGKSFTRLADDYFGTGEAQATDITPNMSAATTSGVTFSASSENSGSQAAWKAGDGFTANYWRPNNNTLPGAWLKIDLGTASVVKHYAIVFDYSSDDEAPTHAATAWYFEGSNDNSTWTAIDDPMDTSDNPLPAAWVNIKNYGSYRYYRWTFTANNGAANEELHVAEVGLFSVQSPAATMVSQTSASAAGILAAHLSPSTIRCRNVSLDEKGAVVYLDPAEWDAGEYEINIRRGWAFRYDQIDVLYQQYDSNANNAYFLDYQLSSDIYKIYAGQKNYRSDMAVEAFQTISDESPFDDAGIAMIAVSVPNVQIQSLYAEFQRYAPIWNGTVWDPTDTLTKNPAAFYRQLLLGGANMKPVPGECVDDVGLAEWYGRCAAEGYESNAIMAGTRVGEAKQMLAACGYASPRDADMYGVVEDYDTSAETYRYLITPMNTKDEGNANEVPDLPHAIRAEFSNEDETYAVDHALVYLDGYDATNATLFETVNYLGITNATKVAARALFDLRQKIFRTAIYTRRVGIEGIGIRRGMVVGLADDTVDGNTAAGKIVSIQTSGSNVTSITLDSIMPWDVESDFLAVDDITSVSDVLDTSEPMGVAIRIPGSDVLIKQVSDVTESNVCTFTTPFALAGSGLEEGQLVVAGRFTKIVRRCKVLHIIPKGFEERLLILVDEAPEIFA